MGEQNIELKCEPDNFQTKDAHQDFEVAEEGFKEHTDTNNNSTGSNSASGGNALLSHKFLQLYAGVVSVSCWVCFTPFYNFQFMHCVDMLTGFHIQTLMTSSGLHLGFFLERTCVTLTHLNSILNPLLFISLKLYMKRERNRRTSANQHDQQPAILPKPSLPVSNEHTSKITPLSSTHELYAATATGV